MSKYNVNANVNRVMMNSLNKIKAYQTCMHKAFVSSYVYEYSICIKYVDDLSQTIQTYPGL